MLIQILLLVLLNSGWSFPGKTQEDENLDYVSVLTDDGDRVARYRGTIVDYNGSRLVLEIRGRRREFPSHAVQKIETKYVSEHLQGRTLLEQREYSQAFQALAAALPNEPRAWVQREIIGLQLQSLQADVESCQLAAKLFLQLIGNERETRYFAWIPLHWPGTAGRSPDWQALATQYMQSSDPIEQLIGASWALHGSERSRSKQILESLLDNSDERVAHLAAAQLWRMSALTAGTQDIARWQKQIERMPHQLRSGPLLVLGKTMARRADDPGSVDRAAAILMRIPILYPQHYQVAAEALNTCGSLLEDQGRMSEANLIYGELTRDFGLSAAAASRAASVSPGNGPPATGDDQ